MTVTGQAENVSGWVEAPLEEFCLVVQGQSPPGETYNTQGEGLPFFQGKAEFGDLYPTPEKWCSAPTKVAEPDDILISIRAPVGPTNLCPAQSCIGRGLAAIRPQGDVLPKYVLYGLRLTAHELTALSTGSTFGAISGNTLRSHKLRLAPVPEQRRIVWEVEKQFTRLDVAVAALKRVQANLKRYRAAVLKAACEGHLVPTEAEIARREGRSYEPASELLKRILAERRSRWETTYLSKLRDAKKDNGAADWKDRYKQPPPIDTTSATALPGGWVTASLEELTSPVRVICYGILMPKDNVIDGIPYVRVLDLKNDRVDVAGLRKTARSIAAAYSRASLKSGDLLLAIRGSYGRVAEVPPELEGGNITQDTARLDVTNSINHRYVATCLRGPVVQNYFKKVARGVAVKGVNIADVRLCPINLPPLAEQGRIVIEVERRLSVIDELEKEVGTDLKRSVRLRQAILKRAFEGRLVPQDANDEPATALLERIRAERALHAEHAESAKAKRRPRKKELAQAQKGA
jgi:type I restriction enzyme S subunit